MKMIQSFQTNKGFTLIELIVSISIFALLSVMTHEGLNNVLDTRERTQTQSIALASIQKTFAIFDKDINQLSYRKIRDEFGETKEALIMNPYNTPILEFTRSGAPNPLKLKRSHLQRIGWSLQEETLVRMLWSTLDRAPDTEPLIMPLLEKVKRLEIRILDQNKNWHNEWPEFTTQESKIKNSPVALEMTIEIETYGPIRRIYQLTDNTSVL